MAVTASDVKVYLSGGASNSDGDLSTGGIISSVEVAATINALFDQVSSAETTSGKVEHRCIYVKNISATTLTSPVIWISSDSASANTSVRMRSGAAAISATEADTGNEDTVPPGTTFFAPSTVGTGISLGGSLAQNAYMSVWIERTVDAGAAAHANDIFTLDIGGDTVA